MKLTAFTQIIVTLAVTAWVFILPVEAEPRFWFWSWRCCYTLSMTE